MDKFLKFPKIRTHELLHVDRFKLEEELYETQYVVTEKIHGTNFALYCTKDGNIEIATREKILTKDELKDKSNILYGIDKLINFTKIRQIARTILNNNMQFEYLIISGEYYGKGIFDMGYTVNKKGINSLRYFSIIGVLFNNETYKIGCNLGINELKRVFNDEELVPIIEIGELSEMLEKYSNKLDNESKLGGETIEGYVLSPMERVTFNYNHECPTNAIKIKGKEFLDIVIDNKKKSYNINGVKVNRLSPYEYDVVTDILNKYMNQQRIESVISHGKYPVKLQHLIGINDEVVKDILDDYLENELNDKIITSLKSVTLMEVKKYLKNKLK